MPKKKQAAFAALNLVYKSAARIRDVELLVVNVGSQDPHNKHLPPTTKFPGGDEEPEDIGDPRVTASRELEQETGLRWPRRVFFPRIHRVQVSRKHFRVGYAIPRERCEGELRTTPAQGGKGATSRGYWMTVSDLREQNKLHQNHSDALDDFVAWIGQSQGLLY